MNESDRRVAVAAAFAAQARAFFRTATVKAEYRGRDAAFRSLLANAERLAREIEKLAPAIDRAVSPENAEYPWERDGQVFRPCSYAYPNLDLLKTAGGRAIMRMVERAFKDYETLRLF